MSDFDKEAEREKLREKYEQEEEKRKSTEQMSELLLKGATMTNAHCSDCGDPIFRYDGQEFCPTCEKPVDRGTGGESADADGEQVADAGDHAGGNGTTPSENIEVADPSDDASVQFGAGSDDAEPSTSAEQARGGSPDQSERSGEATPAQAGGDAEDAQRVPSAAPTESRTADQTRTAGRGRASDQVRTPDPTATTADGAPAGAQTGGSVGDHLDQAQQVLARTIERHARLAAEADSPRETRDHLETAREAAETLDATGY